VGVVCTNGQAFVAAHFLKSSPKIGDQMLEQVTEVNFTV
jgi:hypothetical protein